MKVSIVLIALSVMSCGPRVITDCDSPTTIKKARLAGVDRFSRFAYEAVDEDGKIWRFVSKKRKVEGLKIQYCWHHLYARKFVCLDGTNPRIYEEDMICGVGVKKH